MISFCMFQTWILMMVVSCSRKMKLLDYYNKVLSYSLIVFLLFVLFHIVLTQRDVRETLPLDKYRSVTAGLMEGGSASQNFVIFFFFGFQSKFFGAEPQNNHSSSWRNSWIVKHPVYVTREECSFRDEYHRWTNVLYTKVSRNLAVLFLFITNIYIAHLSAATALHDVAWLTGHTKQVWTHIIVCDLNAVCVQCVPAMYADCPRTVYVGVDQA